MRHLLFGGIFVRYYREWLHILETLDLERFLYVKFSV